MFLRIAFYAFAALAATHTAMASWATRGPEVFIELTDHLVINRVELNLMLACGYSLLWATAGLLLSLDTD